MNELLWILGSTLLVSLISLIGATILVLSENVLRKVLPVLVGFAAGVLIGGSFLHLLPESIEVIPVGDLQNVFLILMMGFVVFFLLEKLLWRHCHERSCPIHTFAYLDLFGDSLHNFIDGLVMAASFIMSIPLGLTTTFAIAAHEVPQELSDFSILIYGGLKPQKALMLNFVTALTAIVGGIVGYYFFSYLGSAMAFMLLIAAGGFLYIAASDLVPELHKETDTMRSIASFASFFFGIIIMWSIRLLFRSEGL